MKPPRPWEWSGYDLANPRPCDALLDEPLPLAPVRTPVHRNGLPEVRPYRWRAGDAEREAEIAARVSWARAEAARRIAATDELREWT